MFGHLTTHVSRQEGRGIGLANKIAAYQLQEQGLDTVDANRALNLPDDSREYTAVANMLADLNVKSIRQAPPSPLQPWCNRKLPSFIIVSRRARLFIGGDVNRT